MSLNKKHFWEIIDYARSDDQGMRQAVCDDKAPRGNGMSCNGDGTSAPPFAMHLGDTPSCSPPPHSPPPYPGSSPGCASQPGVSTFIDEEDMFIMRPPPLRCEETLMSVEASSQDEPLTKGARPTTRLRRITLTHFVPCLGARSRDIVLEHVLGHVLEPLRLPLYHPVDHGRVREFAA